MSVSTRINSTKIGSSNFSSIILSTAANLEFSLHLMEIAFYRLHEGEDWPLIAIPTIVGKTHEVTRGVVKIRYEGKVEPEVEVVATEQDSSTGARIESNRRRAPELLE